jgi:protein TonB
MPAKAAAVLTQPKVPGDLIDLTDGFVTGSSSTVAGGAAASQGASPGTAGGSPGEPPRHASSMSSGPDRSRKPALAGGLEWACPFPPEAEAAGIDDAVASIRVEVDASGAIRTASIESDPGHGFGRAARSCALTKRWSPALDRDGNPVAGGAVVRVRFVR